MADTSDAVEGAYGELMADAGFLVGQSTISLETATEAVEVADEMVDEVLAAWDRSTWGDGFPRDVTRAWLKIATGEYFDRVQGANVTEVEGRGKRLRDEGRLALEDIESAGGPLVNGKRIPRDGGDDADGNDRQIRLWVT